MLDQGTLVLTIQNGLGAAERICEHLPANRVLLGIAGGFGASIKGPGHVHHNGMNVVRVGELSGGLSERLQRVVNLWRGAGFNAEAAADINQLVWEKFVCNVALSAPCTVFGRPIGEMMADPHAWKISLGCGREAFEAGRAMGVSFSFHEPMAYIEAFASKMPDARPSMLLDHMARRPSEIDAINGMVPVVAARVGTAAPYNEVVTAIVKSREEAFHHSGR
jgi:2-dehydropantoate 2-reductase